MKLEEPSKSMKLWQKPSITPKIPVITTYKRNTWIELRKYILESIKKET
jgi:hypothetical protein